MAVDTYTKTGTKATTAAKLDKGVFSVDEINQEILKDAYLSYLSKARKNLAQVKNRGSIRGGGKKPWKQKGTGRARAGSIRSPLWKGGGIIFGPNGTENYTKKTNKTTKQAALRQALSIVAKEKNLKVIDQLSIKQPSTKEFSKLLDKIGATGNVLVVVKDAPDELKKSASNLKNVRLIQSSYLNVYHLLNASYTVMDKASIDDITDKLNAKKTDEGDK